MNNYYDIEITDLFNGELNYSWIKKYKVKSKSIRGAIQKLSRLTGAYHKFVAGDDGWALYHCTDGCIGVTIKKIGE